MQHQWIYKTNRTGNRKKTYQHIPSIQMHDKLFPELNKNSRRLKMLLSDIQQTP